MRSEPTVREKADAALRPVALRFALPVAAGVPILLVGASVIGTRLREAMGLDPVLATAMLPAGIALVLVPAFAVGRMTKGD